jgi:carbonic anhydrase
MVLTIPVELPAAQLEAFGMNLFEINNHPVQSLNDREVMFDFWN